MRAVLKRYVLNAILLLVGLGAAEGLARLALRFGLPGWERTRQLLSGERRPSPAFQNSIGQAYLLYVPAPGYAPGGVRVHNAHGYPGKIVPLERKPGTVRILCLGGSTTYGWGLGPGEAAYPAALETALRQSLPAGFDDVEVINGGIPWGTTAENLTHYHFKFHYYRPDIVVLNVGGNDSDPVLTPHYHPDYSHWRRPLQLPTPLSRVGRALVRSRLAALFVVPLLHGTHPAADPLVVEGGKIPDAPWYDRSPRTGEIPPYPENEMAFVHNLDSLVDEIERDGAKVLLVPFRPAPPGHRSYRKEILAVMAWEEKHLRELAQARNLAFAPFPAETISIENWIDSCHYNERGNRQKAEYLAPFVRDLFPRRERVARASPQATKR